MRKVFNVYVNGVYLQMCKLNEVTLFTSKRNLNDKITFELVEITKDYYSIYF